MDITKFNKVFTDNYRGEENLDAMISLLKNEGASYIETLWVIRENMGLSLKEMDDILLSSSAWRDEKEQIIELRNFIADELEKESDQTHEFKIKRIE